MVVQASTVRPLSAATRAFTSWLTSSAARKTEREREREGGGEERLSAEDLCLISFSWNLIRIYTNLVREGERERERERERGGGEVKC